mgnify:CR=1 FL=1
MIQFNLNSDEPLKMSVKEAVLIKGDDGKSAYQIALDNGFEGSESEWLESLRGKNGYTPVKGKDYFDGKTPVKGKDYFTDEDKSEMVSHVNEQMTPVSYNSQTLTKEQKEQARNNIGAMSNEVSSHNNDVTFYFSENYTVQVTNVQRCGRLCIFCVQILVNESFTSSYGFNLVSLPFAPTSRIWINNGTQFFIDGGSKHIRVNGSSVAKGTLMLNGIFIIDE